MSYFSGTGTLYFADSSHYSGTYKISGHNILRFKGLGTLTTRNGVRYYGDFEDGKISRGTITYPSGSTYEGTISIRGVPDGSGTYTSQSHPGLAYKGEWKAGVYEGQGIISYPSGDNYEGEWKKGKRDGEGKETRDGKFIRGGEWHKDRLMTLTTFIRLNKDGESLKRSLESATNSELEPLPKRSKQ